MGEKISSRMKPESDFEYCYPVMDCSNCGAKDVPFNYFSASIEGEYKMSLYCLNCHQTRQGEPEIKGYVSLIDLEDLDWATEL